MLTVTRRSDGVCTIDAAFYWLQRLKRDRPSHVWNVWYRPTEDCIAKRWRYFPRVYRRLGGDKTVRRQILNLLLRQ